MNRKMRNRLNIVYRHLLVLSALMLSLTSPPVLALCSEAQQDDAVKVAEEALSTPDDVDRVIMLKRALKVCPDFALWLALGKTEMALDNPIDAAYALENARDFYIADEGNTFSRGQILRRAIANSWLAETYKRDDALALAIVATQEATAGYESLNINVPDRLMKLQAQIDDALASANASVLSRSLTLQHTRASRGIGVQARIRTEEEPAESQVETAQMLAEYSGDESSAEPAVVTATATQAETQPATTTTTSRLNIPVLFEFDSDQLSAASTETVAQLGAAIEALNLSEKDSVYIIGHTDAQGSKAYNLALSQRRAESVLRKIRAITDIKAELVASGQGEAELRYSGNDRDDHRRNRRVEMVIRR